MKYRSLAAALAASVALPLSARRMPPTSRSPTGGPRAARRRRSPSSPRPSTPPATSGSTARSPAPASTARPIMISRITGGDPMAATQFNHGRQAEELVEAGLMRDLTDLATAENWADVVNRAVAARELHARRQDLLRAGQHPLLAVAVAVEQGVRGRRRAGPDQLGRVRRRRRRSCARPARSRSPSAAGLAERGRLQRADARARRQGLYLKVYGDKDAEVAAGPGGGEDLQGRRRRPQDGAGQSNVQNWNEATNMVITDAGRRPDHGRLGAGRVPGRGRGRRHGLHLPAGPRRATRSSRPTATPSTSR